MNYYIIQKYYQRNISVFDDQTREENHHLVHHEYIKQNRNKKIPTVQFNPSRNKNNNGNVSDNKFFARFKNLVYTVFSTEEANLLLLQTGFKYNMNSNAETKIFENFGVEVDTLLKYIPNNTEHKYLATNIINSEFMKIS